MASTGSHRSSSCEGRLGNKELQNVTEAKVRGDPLRVQRGSIRGVPPDGNIIGQLDRLSGVEPGSPG